MQRRRYSQILITSLITALNMVALAPAFAQDGTSGTTTGESTSLRGPASTPSGASADSTVHSVTAAKIRKSRRIAYVMAKYEWLDKVAASNPEVLEAICERSGAARILAQHRHIDKMADADHYLCRRITRWKDATNQLIRNPKAAHVINLDPEGIYYAIDRDPHVGTVLASHVRFDEMLEFDPQLGHVLDQHMH
jgi:hypothetical protein